MKKAQFEFKGKLVFIELDEIEEFQLEKSGIIFLIGKLKRRMLTKLQIMGESVTLREIKFKGITK